MRNLQGLIPRSLPRSIFAETNEVDLTGACRGEVHSYLISYLLNGNGLSLQPKIQTSLNRLLVEWLIKRKKAKG
jgi:hypothetical protein